jgi:hypothetical protein
VDNKLTLKLDNRIIEKAKSFAKKNNTSLSALVENYFDALTQKGDSRHITITPTVRALTGVLKIKRGSKIDDLKEQYLREKYLHE